MLLEIYVSQKSQLVVFKVGKNRLDVTPVIALGTERDINDDGALRAKYLVKE